MQCSAVQCSAVQCSAVQCSAVQCSVVLCVAVCRVSCVECCGVLRVAVALCWLGLVGVVVVSLWVCFVPLSFVSLPSFSFAEEQRCVS